MFSQACVILFTGGRCLPQCMLGYHYPLEQTPPRSRHTPCPEQTPPEQTPPEQTPPWEQTPTRADTPQADTPIRADPQRKHPPGADTPQSRLPPQEQTPPWSRHPPEQTPPPRSRPPGSRHAWAVRILLECNLVCNKHSKNHQTTFESWMLDVPCFQVRMILYLFTLKHT